MFHGRNKHTDFYTVFHMFCHPVCSLFLNVFRKTTNRRNKRNSFKTPPPIKLWTSFLSINIANKIGYPNGCNQSTVTVQNSERKIKRCKIPNFASLNCVLKRVLTLFPRHVNAADSISTNYFADAGSDVIR